MSKRGTSYAVDDTAVIGMCAAILLRHRNTHMNLVQRIISTLLYSGHAPKQVRKLKFCESLYNYDFRYSEDYKSCLFVSLMNQQGS